MLLVLMIKNYTLYLLTGGSVTTPVGRVLGRVNMLTGGREVTTPEAPTGGGRDGGRVILEGRVGGRVGPGVVTDPVYYKSYLYQLYM